MKILGHGLPGGGFVFTVEHNKGRRHVELDSAVLDKRSLALLDAIARELEQASKDLTGRAARKRKVAA